MERAQDVHKLMVVFRRPADPAWFDRHWGEDFVVAAEKMPGIRRVVVSRVVGAPTGEADIHLIHEFYFDDAAALRLAMTSAQGQAAGRALMRFAAQNVSLCFAEHFEEDRAAPD